MTNKSLMYFSTKIGDFALTEKMRGDYGITPKNMLVRLSPEKAAKYRSELIKLEARCTKTCTGANFCIFESEEPKVYIEAIEMVLPSFRYSEMLKKRPEPTLEEARKVYKNAFLVLACKPASLCEGKEHLT